MSQLRLSNVSFRYQTQPEDEAAVDDVSIEIDAGSFVGVTGASESGKATLCRLLSGQIPHFYNGELSGEVTVDDAVISDHSIGELSAKIGYVFENPYDQLTGATSTVLEEVAFGLESYGLGREEMREQAREALATIGIEDLADRHPQQLSGGQCQRVAIASVLAMKPEIFILQQPTAQLDPEGSKEVFDVVSKMNDEGYTVVIVSQELERLVPYLDRLVYMENGKIELDGTPPTVLTRAVEADFPITIPVPVDIGHRLRESGLIPESEPVPITSDECLAELRRSTTTPTSTVENTRSPQEPENRDTPEISALDAQPDGGVTVDIDDLHHRYENGIEALSGVSMSLEHGCVCLIGQNGAGKSTLIKHLNGLLSPTKGTVCIRGKDTRNHSVAQLAHDVGLSFQNPDDQLFHSSVEEEVKYGPRNLGYDEQEVATKTEWALEMFGLVDRRTENPYDFGDAWRKRVAAASVVAMDTPIVVLDEPTSGQDAPGQESLSDAVEALVDRGKLVVVITHDMDFVREHADRTILLAQGTVIADGETRAILSDKKTLARSNVLPPTVMELGLELGVGPVLSTDDLLKAIGAE
ncbi:ABC transporter ATP-binding protein [Haladaptatus caseinilyticus]|uniref:ABC transporter ATP-binding protein n=1 Tax=Haladaptatus caseinilyticus TaxID=2993314 RepID=UPI00224AEF90|nr:ABC transporter ATP-binding protein [Haladaptatus caseinilyticus]